MSRSYPTNDVGVWRMYCDRCGFIDADRFQSQPPLTHFVPKGWFIGRLTDLCPTCYADPRGATDDPHSVMSDRGIIRDRSEQ